MNATYTTLTGTEPDIDEQHEARTVVADVDEGTQYMMSEIGDGTFVAWSNCRKCHEPIKRCACAGGPTEPKHITEWREKRFTTSFKGRGAEPALPVLKKTLDRRVDAVIRLLLSKGWIVESPETLHDLEDVAEEFGVDLSDEEPDIIDPDDTEGLSDDPDYGGRVESLVDPGYPAAGAVPEVSEKKQGLTVDDLLNIDEGLQAALDRLKTAKESPDVGF